MPGEHGDHLPCDPLGGADQSGLGRGGDVGREDHPRLLVERMVVRERVPGDHVEPRAGDRSCGEGFGEGVLVHQSAPGGVDQEGAWLHPAEFAPADQTPRLRRERQVQGDHVGASKEIRQGGGALGTQSVEIGIRPVGT